MTGRRTPSIRPVPGATRRVVIVDQDAVAREAAAHALEEQGWSVSALADYGRALLHVRAERPTFALIDVGPFAEGVSLVRQLRLEPGTAAITVVGTGSRPQSRQLLWLFDAFVAKPLQLAKLGAALERARVR